MKKKKLVPNKQNNPVAKYARLFNVATVETDRKKQSKSNCRNEKHKGKYYV